MRDQLIQVVNLFNNRLVNHVQVFFVGHFSSWQKNSPHQGAYASKGQGRCSLRQCHARIPRLSLRCVLAILRHCLRMPSRDDRTSHASVPDRARIRQLRPRPPPPHSDTATADFFSFDVLRSHVGGAYFQWEPKRCSAHVEV